ncbi:ATP synthase F1 subunit epsilon [Patescibacteria group bacterium]|nr:MAG: ATP synthase F1 subunit epsilon [Patescibacteria group bacterium]
MPLHFEITSPERLVLKDEIDQVSIPTAMGEITVLPGHVPLVAELVPGELRVKRNGEQHFYAVAGGFVEVQPDDRVVILADAVERDDELDITAIEAAEERARKALSEQTRMDDTAFAAAAAALEHEMARLRVARKRAPRSTPVTRKGAE